MVSENAISNKQDDKLKRYRFSKNIATKINNYNGDKSISIGLMGAWGSGKTSIINMVRDEIDDESVLAIDFNPWYFSGRKQLISDFFLVLSSYIEPTSGDLQKLGDDLKLYANILKPLTVIPQLGQVFDIIYKVANGGSSLLNEYSKQQNEDISKIKKRINDCLKSYNKKILIIIDEIDRLENEDIKEVFQLVRALGDFDNIIYLLSFDKEKVCKVFTSGEDYLDKIINIPIYVPDIAMGHINNHFISELGKIFSKEVEIDNKYWAQIYDVLFKDNFTNMREVNRFLNNISFNYNVIVKDLNIVDYLAINFIKMFESKLYDIIKENKKTLTDPTKFKEFKEKIKNDLTVKKKIKVEELFRHIFYISKSHRRGIRNKEFFDSYFEYSLPDDVYSIEEIEEYSKCINVSDLEVLLNVSKEELKIFFNNIGDIAIRLNVEQIYFFVEVLIKKIKLLDKKVENRFITESEQSIAFKAFSKLVLRVDEINDEIIKTITNISDMESYELEAFLNLLLDIKNNLTKSDYNIRLLEWLKKCIYGLEYNSYLAKNFKILKEIGFDVREYIAEIIDKKEGLINYLESLVVIVEVGCYEIRDKNGEVIGEEPYEEKAIVLEAITDYIDYNYVKERVEELESEDKVKYAELISEFKNARPYSEVYERFIQQEECYVEY